MTVYAFVPDLMDRSKVVAAVPDAVVVARADAPAAGPGDVVVVALGRAGAEALAGLVASGARVVGFASHVDREGIDAARAAGCEVFARSAFFARVGELLR